MNPCMSPIEVCRGCRECVLPVCRECKVAAGERVDEIWALGRCRRLCWWVLLVEWTAREETDRLRYGGLEEAAKLGMRRSMCGKNLSEGEECRQSSDMVLVERSAHLREVKYLLVKHKS
jgi:hypothetical protein